MNQILEWLSGGDIRSDGVATEISELVLNNPELFDELIEGLYVSEDVVRGRTADTLEKVARSRPDLLIEYLPELMQLGVEDKVSMVRFHIAMILGHLSMYQEHVDEITATLLQLLGDNSVFVKSWTIVSLCIIGRKNPGECTRIVEAIAPLQRDESIAIRSRVSKAIPLLTNEDIPFPKGWIKSEHLKNL